MIETAGKVGQQPDPRCLEKRELPGVFLRLNSRRAQIALPYYRLLKLELSLDDTALELSFATHRVTLSGKNLAEVYTAVAEAEVCVISVAAPDFVDARLPTYRALVRGICIEPLEPAEKQRR